jgi:fructose transport system substrate-binding protein
LSKLPGSTIAAGAGLEDLMNTRDNDRPARRRLRAVAGMAGVAALALTMAACSSAKTTGTAASSASGSGGGTIKMALISANTTNPYFVTLAQAAVVQAKKDGVSLQTTAATSNGDTASQINEVQQAVAEGVKVIIITANGSAVNPAIAKARAAGILVLSVDSVPNPPSTVNMTFATNNRAAGNLIGEYAAKAEQGKHVDIALLDALTDNSLLVDINRDQGFLGGLGVPLNNPNLNNDEAPSGNYNGGTYTIACHAASQGAVDQGRTGMENCLSKDPNINLVYAINEPAAEGAYDALKAAGKQNSTMVVTIDGSCSALPYIKSGEITADSMQFPRKMAVDAIQAGVTWVKTGAMPKASPGLDFHNTGVALVTSKPVPGVPSITPDQAASLCWG